MSKSVAKRVKSQTQSGAPNPDGLIRTPWFRTSTDPVHIGAYETVVAGKAVSIFGPVPFSIRARYWDGTRWLLGAEKPVSRGEADDRHSCINAKNWKPFSLWRGVSRPQPRGVTTK